MFDACFAHFLNARASNAILFAKKIIICMSNNFNNLNQSNYQNSFQNYNHQPSQQFNNSYHNYSFENQYQYHQRNYNNQNYPTQNYGSQFNNSRNYGYNGGNNWNYHPNYNKSNQFNNSYAGQTEMGFPEVGRFGGAKTKNRQKNNTSFSSNAQSSTSSNGPKVKQPSIKQESSNEFCFPTHSETTNFVECPFNSQHIMQPNRLLTHISKCKLKSPNAKHYSVCPYDPSHYFKVTEINAHILVCDKRGLFVANEDWNLGALNSSTISSIPNSLQNEQFEQSTKSLPSSILKNQEKRLYEQQLIDP